MRDTRDPSNTLESLPACRASRPRRGWVQAVLLACAAGRCPRCRAAPDRARKPRPRCCPTKRGARAGPGRPGERRSGQGRAGRHRVHAPGRGPASADGDQPRPGRRRRRPRQAGPRALCDGGPLFHRRRFRRGRAGAAGLRRHRRSRPGKQRPLRRPALYAHVQPCRERDRAGDRGDGAAAGRGSGQRGGAGPVGGRRLDRGAGGGRAGRRARRHQFRGRFGRGSGQIAWQALRARALAGNLCRLRCDHPHAHALDLYRERPVLGPEWPQRWAEAYNAAGGHAQFERLGPDGDNGHSLFTHAPEKWKPLVRDFLRAQGYAMPEPGAASGQARRP